MKSADRAAVTELCIFRGTSGKSKAVSVKGRDFYSLSYRFCGKIWIRYKDTELISERDSITFMPKDTEYETQVIEDTQLAVIHFKLDRDIGFRNPATINTSDGEIRLLFEKLLKKAQADSPVDFECMADFYELLSRLEALELMKTYEHLPKKISLAKKYMLDRFSDSLLSIDVLAESLGVSTSYLRREFSRAYGRSPISFLKELRIKCAKNLLQSDCLSVEEIAAQSGFSSASYFIQVFHKTVGCSPAKYREKTKRLTEL